MHRSCGSIIIAVVCAAVLSACGGSESSAPRPAIDSRNKLLFRSDDTRSDKTQASDYASVVQELYISYYGRPADPAGMAYWEGVLLRDNAPTSLAALNAAYSTNAAVAAILNSFGTSAESQALYGTGNVNTFVTAIYNNALGRPPDSGGLDYWVGLVNANKVSQAQAATAIIAGAAIEATTSTDEQLVANRLFIASYFTSQIVTAAELRAYSGEAVNAVIRTMLDNVTATTDTIAYEAIVNAYIAAMISSNSIYTVGVSISGLTGTVALTDGAGASASTSVNGTFILDALTVGSTYAVTVTGQPADQSCSVSGGAGTIASANVTVVVSCSSGVPGIITTVAGNGKDGYTGDDGPATAAEIGPPMDVALDTSGNIYIADNNYNRVRMVSAATGIITTVAGNGTRGYSGDGGVATSASLNGVEAVAVDASGNLYIVDSLNNRIRKVSATTGTITTVAGNGTAGYAGDNGPAASAELLEPSGVAVDASGNLYIADNSNSRIRKVSATSGIITTVAGNGMFGYAGDNGPATSAEFRYPSGVAVDASGNLYIADSNNNRIRKVSAATGIITTVAGNGTAGYAGDGGPATSAELHYATGAAVDAGGNLYIADYGNNVVRVVIASTGNITTVAGDGYGAPFGGGYTGDNGPATSAELDEPSAVAVDASGNLYIADSTNNVVRKVTGP